MPAPPRPTPAVVRSGTAVLLVVVVPSPATALRLLLASLLLARAVVRAAAEPALPVRAVGRAAVLRRRASATHAVGTRAVEALLEVARVAAVAAHLRAGLRGQATLRRRVVGRRAGARTAKRRRGARRRLRVDVGLQVIGRRRRRSALRRRGESRSALGLERRGAAPKGVGHPSESGSSKAGLRLGSAHAAVIAEAGADAVVLAVERGLEASSGRRAVVVRRLGRHVIRRSIDASLVGAGSVALAVRLSVVRVVVRVVEVGVAAVRVALLPVRLRLRRRRLAGGLLRHLGVRRGVGGGVTAALRVGRHAAEPRLVVQGGDAALGVLAQVVGLRRVRVAAERALRLRLLSSDRSVLLAELLLVLAILLAVVVVGKTARVVRRVV